MDTEKHSQELSVDSILSLTLNLYRSKFMQFFLPFLISGIITGITTYILTSSFPIPEAPIIPQDPDPTFISETLIPWFSSLISTVIIIASLSALAFWLVGTIVTGVAVKNASDQIENGTSNLGASFNYIIPKLPKLLTAQLIVGVLTAIGMVFLIVPGILIAIMFSLVLPTIIIEHQGIFDSLGRSRRLVSNRWMNTFILALIAMIIVGIPLAITNFLTMPLADIHPIINPLITNIATAFVSPIYVIALTYLYYSMLARENQTPQSTF